MVKKPSGVVSWLVRKARAASTVLAFVAAGSALLLPSSTALSNPATAPANYSNTTPSAISTTVPNGVCSATITAVGGAGASSGTAASLAGGIGAGGANITATFRVLPLQLVTGTVGQGGQSNGIGGSGADAGGAGGTIVNNHRGGGGGGATDVIIGGLQLIEAGGGGGGGGAHQATGNGGGGGSAGIAAGVVAVGLNGTAGSDSGGVPNGGQGGQAAAGGAGGVNTGNAARNGAAGSATGPGGNGGPDPGFDSGGGGGGGFTGGGGGASTIVDSQTGGGGGGGSSFVRLTSPIVAVSNASGVSGSTNANTGQGAVNGANGSAAITWIPCTYQLAVTKTASPSPVNAGQRTVWTVSVTNNGPDPMTRGDVITLTDTLPAGPNGAPSPAYRVLSIATSGGSDANMQSGALTCTGVTVGSSMPASTVCSRPYSATSAAGAPSGGTRGLNVGETLTITYEQVISSTAPCATITNTAAVNDRSTSGSWTSVARSDAEPLNVQCYDLQISKSVTPSSVVAGDNIAWSMTVTNNGPANMSGPDDTVANLLTVADVAPTGSTGAPFSFTSSGPAGSCSYAAGTISCPGNLASGQSQTFSFSQTVNVGTANGTVITNTASVSDPRTGDTNDSSSASTTVAARPRLTLVKTVTNDNGGTQAISAWTLSATGPSTISGASGTAAVTNQIVNAGVYTLAETGPTGYAMGAWSCTAGTLSGSSLTLIAGQNATCTVNNNDIQPTLTLVKTVTNDNGGTQAVSAWTLTATGPTNISGASGTAAVTNAGVNAGVYTLGETGPAGYTMGTWSCTSGTLSGSSLTLTPGQNATCTVNNNDIQPRLTLVKTVTNDNGGTQAVSAWTLTATGPTNISGASGTAAVTNAGVNAGVYTLGETGPAGYAMGSWSCTSGSLSGSTLTLTPGQSATCTVNNNDIQPTLTLVKTVTNDNGGTQAVSAWTLTATGPTNISGASGTAAVTNAGVNAGVYTLGETGPAGYTMGAWSCTSGSLSGSTLTLTPGQNATCTVNNNDIQPILTLVKTVTNDNGGTQTVSAWTLTATGPTNISGASGTAAVTNAGVNAGVYTLGETGPAGYAMGAWSCTSGSLAGSSLTLTPGQNATCTVNNNDVAPVLTLVKTVTNDNGGTAVVTAWTLSASGPTNISGTSGSAPVTNASVNAGVYVLAESGGPSGYTMGSWSCTAGSLSGANLTLSVGQVATCTINNNDISPRLTLVKTITGDTTPSEVPSFTLTATGPTPISGVTGNAAVTNAAVNAGVYALSESGPSGYSAAAWSCTAGSLSGSNLTLTPGVTATCTINNTRLPTVSVQKITTGGAGGPFSFADTNITGSFANITTAAAGTATPASPTPLVATLGSAASITESFSLAWVTGGVVCTDSNAANSGNSNPVATSATSAVTIPAAANRAGAIINCVFTNAAAVPSLSMTKTPSIPSVNAAGQSVTYSILVNNTGNTVLGPITVTDAFGIVTCPSSGGTTVTSLAVGASETCTFSYTVPQAVLDANGGGDGDIDNTASASTTYNGLPVSGNASAVVTLVITPSLVIDKIADYGGTPVIAGDTVTYRFRVRNTGNVTVTSVGVNDTFNGYGTPPVPGSEAMFADAAPLGDSSDGATNGSWDSLAPGDEIEFTATYNVVQADIDNP